MTGVDTPDRVKLVVDLQEGRLAAGSVTRSLAGPTPTPDQVLATYLSLVYTLRHTQPGTAITLRAGDLDVLAEVLRLTEGDVEQRLTDLMADPGGEISLRTKLLRGRVLIPVAGLLVAVTAAGALLLVADRDVEPGDPAVLTPDPAGGLIADVGSALVQTPDGDGGSSRVFTGDGVRADELGPGDVGLGSPQVAVRGPDGSIVQAERRPDAVDADATTTTSTP